MNKRERQVKVLFVLLPVFQGPNVYGYTSPSVLPVRDDLGS